MPKFSTLIQGAMVLFVFASFGFNWNPEKHWTTNAPIENLPTENFFSVNVANIVIDDISLSNPTDCDVNDGNITLTATGTGALEYSINGGGMWQMSNSFDNLSAGLYTVVIREVDLSCITDPVELELTAPNAPTIQEIVTNDPASCDISNGVIVISAADGTGSFEYSIDGGLNWQALNTFSGLSSGAYAVAVRNTDDTCVITGGLVNLIGDPSEPLISDIFTSNPTDCDVDDGIITISVSNASGTFEYSINGGGNWGSDNSFNNLPGGTYDILVRKTDETCEVSGGLIQLTEPAQPVISSVNPINPTNCVSMDGTIVIEADAGGGFLEYSVDNGTTWLTSNTFFNLMEGTYTIAVRNTNGSCVTVGETVELIAPTEPVISNVFASDPTDCLAENGGIIVDASGCIGDIEFSIDAGVTYQASGTFPNLAAGDYEILIRNVGETETITTGILTLTSPQPPVIDMVNSTEPDCSGAGGNITIMATGNNGNLEYSIDGGSTWQVNNSFDNIMAGDYTAAVRFPNSGCITTGDQFTLSQSGNSLNIEEVITHNPGCGNPNGTITINITTGVSLEFTIDGGTTWQAANFFDNLPIGDYTPGARLEGGGCETILDVVTLVAAEEPEIQEVFFGDVSDCGTMDATIIITATGTIDLEYSINGGLTWEESGEYIDLPVGDYEIFVRNNDGTCSVEFDMNPVTIGIAAGAPVIDEIQITPPVCGANNGEVLILASGNPTIEYSIDGGQTFQLENNFTNLPVGVYDLVLQFPGENCQTLETVQIVNGISCQDTINVEIPFETNSEICLDETVLQIDGTITDAEFCTQGSSETVFASVINSNCVSLVPGESFLGISPDTICAIHCYDNDPNLCDTTYIIVTVVDVNQPCEEVFNLDTITVMQNGNPTEVCLPIPTLDAFNSDLFLNGNDYVDNLNGCLEDSIIFYTYALLSGGGFDGPFTLDSWMVNGNNESGTFANAVELVNLMNTLDPTGNWTIDTDLSIIESQNAIGDYGNMNILHDPSGNMTTLQTNITSFPNGTVINVTETGINEFVVTNPNTGCSDTIYINIETITIPTPIPTDTVITTFINTPTDEILIDDSELPGGIDALTLCELTANGGVGFPNNSFIYNPNTDFIGKDTFCIQACNADNPAICDTVNVIVCVIPPTDTLNLDMTNTEVIDTCLNDLIQLPDGIATAEICGVNDAEITTTLDNDCINLDPQDDFSGITEICVVHCDANNNCDTSYIIINVEDIQNPMPTPLDTVITTLLNTATDEIFIDDSELPAGPNTLNLCESAENGEVGFTTNSFIYNPNTDFLGKDTFCIEICKLDFPDLCDTVNVIACVVPPTDTLLLDIGVGEIVDTCLNDLIQLPTGIATADICGVNVGQISATLDNDCINLDPQDGFFGITEVCVVHCDANNNCDTTYIIMDVENPCPDIFGVEFIEVESDDDTVVVCVPAPDSLLINSNLFLDGVTYTGGIESCDDGMGGMNIQILVSGVGVHIFRIVNIDTGCSDEIQIIISEVMTPPDDTIFVTIPQGTENEIICGNGDELPGDPFNVGFCEVPSNGVAPILNDSCVAYTPGAGFFGMDEFCMIVCDDLIPSTCDTFIVIITVTPTDPPIDTIFIDAESTMAIDTCLDGQFIQLPGTIASAENCGFNTDDFDSFVIDNECITFDLVDDFTGTTEACVVHCDDSVPQVCDTTIFIINFEEMPCPDIIAMDTITLLTDTSTTVDYCLPIPTADILNYNLTVDGMEYSGDFNPCDVDSIFIYNYSLVPSDGPYDIDWDAGFADFMGTVQTIEELVDSMNVWDPAGNWMNNPMGNILMSDNEVGMYGVLMITQVSTQISNDLQPNFTGVPLGTQLTFDSDSNHNLVVENIETGCTDSVYIQIIPTIFIETIQNTPSETVCLDTLDLPGNFDTLQVCSQPNEGMILIDGNCFTYLPLGGFIGMDTTWIKVCDDQMNCDSTLIIINIESACDDFGFLQNDTLSVLLEDCAANAEICLPITLDSLLMGYNIQDNGAPYSEGFAGCDFDTCINYSSFSIPDLGNIGPYTLNSWTVGDTTFMGAFMDINALIDSMNFWNPGINWALDNSTGNIRGCNITETYGDLQITQDISGQMAIVDAVPDFFPNGSELQLPLGFHELVFVDIETGCTDTLFADISCDTIVSCEIMPLGSTFVFVDDCNDTGEFCLDLSVFDLEDYQVTVGDTIFSTLSTCSTDPQLVSLVLPVGTHEVVFEDTVKMCVDNFTFIVSCTLFEDITIDTIVNEGASIDICLDDLEFPLMEIDSVINVCADQTTGNADFAYDDVTGCITILGELEGLDTACFKVYLLDTCATVFINVEIQGACMIDIIDADNVGAGITDCALGTGDICLPIPFVEFPNYTLEVGGVEYTGATAACDFDSVYTIAYSLFPSGGAIGPYIIDSWCINGNEFTGVVDSPQDLVDSLAIWDPGCEWEIQINGSTTSIVGGCSGNVYCEQMVVQQELNPGVADTVAINQNFFPNGTQITLAAGTFELMLTDTMGCFDLVTATLECVETDTFIANIPVDSTAIFCIDTMDLPGSLVSIFNACADDSGEFVQFEIVSDTCITYTGVEVGTDTACIVICDDLGICDTTYLFITATSDETQPPIAIDDDATSGQNQPPININVITNDSFIVVLTDIFILTPPNFGDVEYLGDGNFQYVPDEGYCDSVVPDSFTYVVCNTVGCDTATVFITILCTEFEIFGGFSPNTDEVNDTWVIRGIEQFENHIVRIFNRWGSMVYETRDYHLNEWEGKWDGNDVPDGTYFYVVDLGNGEVLKGYVEVRR